MGKWRNGLCPLHARVELGCPHCERRRRLQAMGDWLASLRPWSLVANLTFDPDRCRQGPYPPGPQRRTTLKAGPRLSEDGNMRLGDVALGDRAANARLGHYLREAESMIGRPLFGVFVLEYQQSGWPHFHGLLGAEGGLAPEEVASLGRLWQEVNGLSRIEPPRNLARAAGYTGKHLANGEGEPVWWRE